MVFVFPLSIKRLFTSLICHWPARMRKDSWLSCQWWLAALPHESIPETLQSRHKLIFTVCGRSSTLEPPKTHGPNINCVHGCTHTHKMCKYSPSISSHQQHVNCLSLSLSLSVLILLFVYFQTDTPNQTIWEKTRGFNVLRANANRSVVLQCVRIKIQILHLQSWTLGFMLLTWSKSKAAFHL